MPISFDVYPGLGLFVTRYQGVVTDEQFRDAYARIRPANPNWLRLNEIADMRAMNSFAVAHSVLQKEAELTGRYLAEADAHVRCAFVAPEDLPFALSRVYGAHADFAGREEVHVFRDAESAVEWLGIPETGRQEIFASPKGGPSLERAGPASLSEMFRARLKLASKG